LPGLAQTSRFTGFVGGGFSEPVKALGTRLDRGWNAAGGVGINFNDHFGGLLDFSFNDFGINRTALNNAGAPGGTTRIWSVTLDPIVHLASVESRADLYLTGGGGIYHRTVEFTQPAVATVAVIDPWWGIVYPASFLTNQVIGSYSTYKPGFNVGAGVAFKISGNTKLFAEARYHHMFTNGLNTTYVPVTVGLRW
jgi:opacity protein-like surface antigen